jgi:pseudouridine synthase
VVDLVPTEERVFALGRLDRSSGLILVTNDGEFANRLTHPRYGVTKTYLVRVAGSPSQAELAKLRRGVHLAEGFCKVESLHVKGKHKGSTDMIIVLSEGRNREIRRILARVGHKVVRLKRLAVGRLKLSDLPLGLAADAGGDRRALAEAKERKQESAVEKPDGLTKPVHGQREPSPEQQRPWPVRAGRRGGSRWEGGDDFSRRTMRRRWRSPTTPRRRLVAAARRRDRSTSPLASRRLRAGPDRRIPRQTENRPTPVREAWRLSRGLPVNADYGLLMAKNRPAKTAGKDADDQSAAQPLYRRPLGRGRDQGEQAMALDTYQVQLLSSDIARRILPRQFVCSASWLRRSADQ